MRNLRKLLLGVWLMATLSGASASVLLGTGTLNNANDLTRIQNGSAVLEFLDLTATQSFTPAGAVTAYAPNGFRWANGAEVAALYDAFGITYTIAANTVVDLGVSFPTAANFVSYLGVTAVNNAALGWIDDLTGGGFNTYSCISSGDCGPTSFVNNSSVYTPPESIIGVYLVRDAAVPEPATVAIVSLGLALFGLRRKLTAQQ